MSQDMHACVMEEYKICMRLDACVHNAAGLIHKHKASSVPSHWSKLYYMRCMAATWRFDLVHIHARMHKHICQPTHMWYRHLSRHQVCSVCKTNFSIAPPRRLDMLGTLSGVDPSMIQTGMLLVATESMSAALNGNIPIVLQVFLLSLWCAFACIHMYVLVHVHVYVYI